MCEQTPRSVTLTRGNRTCQNRRGATCSYAVPGPCTKGQVCPVRAHVGQLCHGWLGSQLVPPSLWKEGLRLWPLLGIPVHRPWTHQNGSPCKRGR